jgi:hypothetical protein
MAAVRADTAKERGERHKKEVWEIGKITREPKNSSAKSGKAHSGRNQRISPTPGVEEVRRWRRLKAPAARFLVPVDEGVEAVLEVVSIWRGVAGINGCMVRPTVARWGFSPAWFLSWRGTKVEGREAWRGRRCPEHEDNEEGGGST